MFRIGFFDAPKFSNFGVEDEMFCKKAISRLWTIYLQSTGKVGKTLI